MIELPVVFGLLWVLVSQFGLLGAALTVIVRALMDGIILNLIINRLFNEGPTTASVTSSQ